MESCVVVVAAKEWAPGVQAEGVGVNAPDSEGERKGKEEWEEKEREGEWVARRWWWKEGERSNGLGWLAVLAFGVNCRESIVGNSNKIWFTRH